MITSEQCKSYLAECEVVVLGTASGLSIHRAIALMGVCHALVALGECLKRYERVVQEENVERPH